MATNMASIADGEVVRLLQDGISAARRGDKQAACDLLSQVVELDPQIEEAWMWLSGVVSEPHEQQICLENVLVINPTNAHALKGLEQISQGTGGIPRFAPETAEPLQAEHTAPLAADPSLYGEAIPAPPWPSEHDTGSNSAKPAPLPAWMQAGHVDTGLPQSEDPIFSSAEYPSGLWSEASSGGVSDQREQSDVLFGVPEWQPMAAATGDSAFQADAPSQDASSNGDAQVWGSDSAPDTRAEHFNNFVQAQPGGHLPDEGDPNFRFEPFSFEDSSRPGDGSSAQVVGTEGSELPDWVRKHLSPAAESAPQEYAPPQEIQPAPEMFGDNFFSNSNSYHEDAHDQNSNESVYPDMPASGTDLGSMGPYAAVQLPSPDELPGEHSSANNPAQPWYLNSSNNSIASPPSSETGLPSYLDPPSDNGYDSGAPSAPREVVNIECPNCHEQVPDTSLACPQCRFNFFVNCPHCHELVDASDARAGQEDPCPHCGNPVDKMVLGIAVSPQERAAAEKKILHQKSQDINYPSMDQAHVGAAASRSVLSWLVDGVLLAAIAFIIWALTQFPTWYHLTGLYK